MKHIKKLNEIDIDRDPFGRPSFSHEFVDDWEKLTNEDKVIRYFTTLHGDDFSVITNKELIDFCEYNKIDIDDAKFYIDTYIMKKDAKNIIFDYF